MIHVVGRSLARRRDSHAILGAQFPSLTPLSPRSGGRGSSRGGGAQKESATFDGHFVRLAEIAAADDGSGVSDGAKAIANELLEGRKSQWGAKSGPGNGNGNGNGSEPPSPTSPKSPATPGKAPGSEPPSPLATGTAPRTPPSAAKASPKASPQLTYQKSPLLEGIAGGEVTGKSRFGAFFLLDDDDGGGSDDD